ncbi:MAG: DUF456 domain-containing protein [Anaerolineaceae bacterium]|jgi:uncharacterized protein YqgC (DUF456 family)|nr:DUF456 domain-containing protein [Anaerolineaceae bacterium]MDD4042841.1 DUF456 domain-containing protein [Anaerolineaceae bacterium]MDD4578681.1 DUF456 domain-containing protein [Anaerolineaceae bacterium]
MTSWTYYLVLAISAILNLVGLVGLLLVFFPGLTVAWVGQLIWVIFVGFNKSHEGWQFGLTIAIFVVNTIIMIIGTLLDNILGAAGTRKKGVPWWEIFLVMVIMVVGGIFLTPIGGLAISLGTLFLIEYYRLEKDSQKAWESTKALAFGYGTAAIIRFFLCLLMIGLWVFMVVFL